MGKTVIVVGDQPGFWVNRILSPYLNEAGILLMEGAPIDAIDRVMTRFGFPVGPGDAARRGRARRGAEGGGRDARGVRRADGARPIVRSMMADGRLGRKNGRGFYRYRGRQSALGPDDSVYQLRASAKMPNVDEPGGAAAGVRHAERGGAAPRRMASSARRATATSARSSASGFPPFRGGPLRMIDSVGAAQVVRTLRELGDAHGARFDPAPSLVEMAGRGGRYYPDS